MSSLSCSFASTDFVPALVFTFSSGLTAMCHLLTDPPTFASPSGYVPPIVEVRYREGAKGGSTGGVPWATSEVLLRVYSRYVLD